MDADLLGLTGSNSDEGTAGPHDAVQPTSAPRPSPFAPNRRSRFTLRRSLLPARTANSAGDMVASAPALRLRRGYGLDGAGRRAGGALPPCGAVPAMSDAVRR